MLLLRGILLTSLLGCQAAAAPKPDPARVPLPPPRPAFDASGTASAGGLCGDPRLEGSTKVRLTRPILACGIGNPVKVERISGIRLTTPATLECSTARRFADWLTQEADPAARQILGGRIEKVWMMGAYSCRSRNSQKGARLSEHAFGRAIDVGGVWLSTGRKVTVKENWGKGTGGQFLRRIWKAACGPFKTVLGPDGDRFHQDHLHFDLAKRRSTFCR
ncbi:MAG: extensin family protein [Pseudomonadota bacterium]